MYHRKSYKMHVIECFYITTGKELFFKILSINLFPSFNLMWSGKFVYLQYLPLSLLSFLGTLSKLVTHTSLDRKSKSDGR